MKLQSGSKTYQSGHGHDEDMSSKRHRSSEEGEASGSEKGGSRTRKIDEQEQLADMDTSYRREYMLERSVGGRSDSKGVLLEMEFEYSTECVASDSREGIGRGRRK